METDRQKWNITSYESRVEKFYGLGAENYGEHHGGYLNFGLWDEGIKDYISAAENLVITLAKSIGLNRHSHLLDVACGLAVQDILMHQKFQCKIEALDVTWKHVLLGRERIQKAGVETFIKFHHGSATKLPFPNDYFTQVMGIEGPAHFHTREDFFKESYRVLKPGGVMGLSDYVLKRKPSTFLQKMFLESTCLLWHAPRANRDTVETYILKLKNCGFKDIIIESVGKKVIPGYYSENRKKETLQSLARARGYLTAQTGKIIDYLMYTVFQRGIIEYILVSATKPGAVPAHSSE